MDLSLNIIKIGKTNPRKTFDDKSLDELSQSIKEKGVLQPILVRPKGKNYELICGERRYRAAKMAKLKWMPANIRELSDDEAFEMQIIENLERKDVHPIEEAEAFKRMLDSGKYQLADIAAKMAKPESFIAQRLKLTELIDDIKKDFFNDELGIGHAIQLARLDPEHQKEIFEKSKMGWDPGYGTIKQLKGKIENGLYNLEEAPFDTADENLFKKAGSCLNCPKRSGSNPTLFGDVENENTCFDTGCYSTKIQSHLINTVSGIINEGKDTPILKDSYSDVDPEVVQLAKDHKIPILKEWDDFHSYSYDKKDVKRKGFYVSGRDTGKFKMVFISSKSDNKVSGEENSVQEQIEKIETRAARSLELDDEKVWNAVRNGGNEDAEFKVDTQGFLDKTEKLSVREKWALLIAIEKNCHYLDIPFLEDKKVEDVSRNTVFPIPNSVMNQAFRKFIYVTLNQSYGSHTTSMGNAAFFQALKEHDKKNVEKICNHFQEKAKKRISRTNERLEKLKS